jgi:UMF1 family MFS transporter
MVEVIETAPAPAGAGKDAGRLAQFAWAAFDGARSPYNVLINIFIFSAYFSTVVVPDPVRGQAAWSFLTSIAAAGVAIGAPILGAIADAGGRRKPWLLGCVLIGAPCMMATWFAAPGMTSGLALVMAGLIVANMTFEYSAIFCNAMLPNIARPERFGFLSGLGFALGNAFGIAVFLFFLLAWSWNPHPLFGLDLAAHQHERAVGILAGLWWAVFAIPLFLFTPDSPSTLRSAPEAIRHGLRQLGGTLAKIGQYRNVVTFLVARMSYNEGFIALMLFTGVFAAGILHWSATMLTVEGLINSVAAVIAALLAGWLDDRIGSKPATLLFVAGGLIANLVLWSVGPDQVFFTHIDVAATSTGGLFPTLPDKVFLAAQCSIAFFVTGGLVTSRSMMAKVSPRHMLNEFFGLFALSGTSTAFIGPLAIGIITTLTHTQRAGVAVGVVFLAVGFLGMFFVKEERAA